MTGAAVGEPAPALLADLTRVLGTAPLETPEDRFEAWAWGAMLDRDGPALLTRHCAPAHVTASAMVLAPDTAEVCLVLHGRTGCWVQPGGHLEPGDTSLAGAAAREVLEETGLTGAVLPRVLALSRHHAPCRPVVDWHLDVQHILLSDRRAPQVSAESRDVAWWPVDRLPSPLAGGVAESLAVARRLLPEHAPS